MEQSQRELVVETIKGIGVILVSGGLGIVMLYSSYVAFQESVYFPLIFSIPIGLVCTTTAVYSAYHVVTDFEFSAKESGKQSQSGFFAELREHLEIEQENYTGKYTEKLLSRTSQINTPVVNDTKLRDPGGIREREDWL